MKTIALGKQFLAHKKAVCSMQAAFFVVIDSEELNLGLSLRRFNCQSRDAKNADTLFALRSRNISPDFNLDSSQAAGSLFRFKPNFIVLPNFFFGIVHVNKHTFLCF